MHTYSDHILFPIELETKPGEARQINAASALWQRPKSEIKPEDYTQAYRTLAGAFDEPAMTLHYKVEGRQTYAVLLFAPSQRPFDLFDPERKGRVKLYVRRVYITDDADLLAPYLRFVRGVIDSEDLPLNISREMLQNNPQVAAIRNAVTGRVIGELESLAGKDAAAFNKIWEAFGSVIKEGIYEDRERRDQLLALARFATTKDAGLRSLKEYVADLQAQPDRHLLPRRREHRPAEGEPEAGGGARPRRRGAAAHRSRRRVLDGDAAGLRGQAPQVAEPGRRRLRPGAAAGGEEGRGGAEAKPSAVDDAVTIAAVKTALGERVSDVRASQRLTDSAACLVASGAGPDRELDRLLGAPGRPRRRQADPGDQHAPRAGEGAGRRQARRRAKPTWPTSPSCCWPRRRSSTGWCPTTRRRSRGGSTGWW